MLQRLVRIEGDVRTACDDGFSAFSEFASKAIGFRCESGEKGECYEVSVGVEVNGLHLLMNDTNLVARRRQGC